MSKRAISTVFSGREMAFITSSAFVRSQNLLHHHVAVAISIKTGNILASGTNFATSTGSIHAEVAATMQLKQRLRDRVLHLREINKGVHVVSLRVSKSGSLRLAKPCQNCRRTMIQSSVIRGCLWSKNDENFDYERFS